MEQCLICPLIHERRLHGWVTQKINRISDAANSTSTTWVEFTIELDEMFVDLNHQATTRRKLATLCCKCTKRALSTPTVHTTDREKEGGKDSLSAIVSLLS